MAAEGERTDHDCRVFTIHRYLVCKEFLSTRWRLWVGRE